MRRLLISLCLFPLACTAPEASGLALTPEGPGAKVKFDVFHRPLPEIPLPNDFASRFDATSFTKKRVNASQVAPTAWESKTRTELDALDGWGTLGASTVSFETALDTENVIRRHWGDRFDTSDDVMLVVDVTPGSPEFCKASSMGARSTKTQTASSTAASTSGPRTFFTRATWCGRRASTCSRWCGCSSRSMA